MPISFAGLSAIGRRGSQRRRCTGVTYLAVIFLLALAGITATATGILWRVEHRRQMEAELLFAGAEFASAIESFRAVAPNVPQPWPRSLEELVRDPRFPGVRRHLRKVYRDPVGRSSEWGLIRTPEGGIVGVHSLSSNRPVRRGPAPGLTIREPDSYTGWLFVARGAPTIVRDSRSGMWMATGPAGAVPGSATPAAGTPPAAATPPGAAAAPPLGMPAGASAPPEPQAGNIGAAATTTTPTAKPATQPPRKRTDCSVIARNDLSACAAVAQQFGSTDGDACVATARAREAQCAAGGEVTTPLAVRYF